jgi:hypothetical protein
VRLAGEHVDLRPVLLEPVRMEVLAHDGLGVLELGLEPRRRVGEAFLRRGEDLVGFAERLGEPRAIQRFASQASRRSTIRCCGGKAPVFRKYSCSTGRKSGNSLAMGPEWGW